MIYNALRMICGFTLDTLFGDPGGNWHPVVLIGKLISFLERGFFPKTRHFRREFVLGFLMVGLMVGGVGGGYFILSRFLRVQKWGDLESARKKMKHLVGRDTDHFAEWEVVRACIESLAESFNDGIIAPFFYMTFFGALGGLVYKVVNTLDSMLGYKDFRYYFFGFASARLDDVMNFVPARLSIVFIGIAALILGRFWKGAFHCAWRDARKHPSPNAGWPESAVAGALGVRLGGTNYYAGKREEYPFLGDPLLDLTPARVDEALSLIRLATWLGVGVFVLLSVGISILF
ncbi:MAG: adenosylcobinamide-phosphate synthase CbiB [Candidatus Atribacteria bacterium]|nr:adenosylcobinamide-phosphate synthase CbiB [Candidatus Atribacteria bacterium]